MFLHRFIRRIKTLWKEQELATLQKQMEARQKELEILEDSDLDKQYLENGGYKDKKDTQS